ncbi:MAG: hypothetical protein HDT25_02085 [Ruminococcus sp.]|nr:hypothetical protein [Ruminococcus sp.]
MKFKRLFPFFVTLIIILSMFTACDSSNYKKAVKLMESGNYEEAKAILTELKDYKDSADLIYNCNWEIVLNYYKNKYKDMRTKPFSIFEVSTESNGEGLNVLFLIENDVGNIELSYTINKENPKEVNVNAEIKDNFSGTTTVDLSGYKIIESLNWNINNDLDFTKETKYDLTEKVNELNKLAVKVFDATFQTSYLSFEKSLKDSGLGITLEDLGIC